MNSLYDWYSERSTISYKLAKITIKALIKSKDIRDISLLKLIMDKYYEYYTNSKYNTEKIGELV